MYAKVITKVRETTATHSRVVAAISLPLILTATGVMFAVHALVVGHDHVFGTTRDVPWGLLITPYAFFACLATGLSILSALGQVFSISALKPLVPQTTFLAIIAMAAALFAIGLEVESPWRVGIYGILSPNPLSNIWWKSTLYTLFLLLMCINYALLLIGKERMARWLGLAALIAIGIGNLNLKADIALLGARSFWAENYMPLFFLTVSVLISCAAFVLLRWISTRLSRDDTPQTPSASNSAIYGIFMVSVIVLGGFVAMKIVNGFSPVIATNPEAMNLLIRGDYAINFWLGEVALGVIIPIILLLLSKAGSRSGPFALAGLSAMTGVFITFYDIIVVGQLIPHYSAYGLLDYPVLYSYQPTVHEFMIATSTFALFLSMYILGEQIFRNGRTG
ncbi:MAG: hypothetical protein D6B25_06815 [Desulfobulbaceae bacterium]|nr:MAG: hypothetical protein D6B25_06815 [Desulfobulbaceae bacterium]